MPLPTPEGNEDIQKFLGRCLHDLKHEKNGERWPDHKQRLAVCFSQFNRAHESTETIIADWVKKLLLEDDINKNK